MNHLFTIDVFESNKKIEDLIESLIRKNLPEEIYNIGDLLIDLKDECNFNLVIRIEVVYNFGMSNVIRIPLDPNMDPDLSSFLLYTHNDSQNYTQIYKMIKDHIANQEMHSFFIHFITPKNKASEVSRRAQELINVYDRSQKSIRMFTMSSGLTVQIKVDR